MSTNPSPAPFTFEILTPGYDEKHPRRAELVDSLQAVLKYAAEIVPLDERALEAVVLAKANHFPEAIYSLQRKAGHRLAYSSSDRRNLVATVAKTISFKKTDGTVTSTIVYNGICLEKINNKIQNEILIPRWTTQEQEFLYIFSHERGHCRDNFLRRATDGDVLDRNDPDPDPEKIIRHYIPIIISEFLACFYSAGAVSPAVHDKQIGDNQFFVTNNHQNMSNALRTVGRLGQQAAASAAGFALSQYAKLYGSRAGNDKLAKPALWTGAPKELEPVFAAFDRFLVENIKPDAMDPVPGAACHRAQDPHFDLDEFAYQNLIGIFREYAKAYGIEL